MVLQTCYTVQKHSIYGFHPGNQGIQMQVEEEGKAVLAPAELS